MKNVSDKIETLRTATAEVLVTMQPATAELVRRGDGPKGDPLPLVRAAAVLAAKKTAELIPYCHPLFVDHVGCTFEISDRGVSIRTTVTAVAKTGVEMEALTAASVAALTLYDMLKPVDTGLEISQLRLVEKRGGKSNFPTFVPKGFKAAIVVTSDGTFAGKREDKSGKLIFERLVAMGVAEPAIHLLPDDRGKIFRQLLALCEGGADLILTTGGTGLGPRDVTVEATREVIEREVPGIAEAMRSFGQRRTPYAMLSRGVAGIRGKTLLVNLPGSSKGVEESMAAIFPHLFHLYPILEGGGH